MAAASLILYCHESSKFGACLEFQARLGQADGIQPRTMEIWDSLGMGDKLRHAGSHVYQMVWLQFCELQPTIFHISL
ncbi:hypothetical protein A0H81_02920 [Grifola frondosa]|uniref:Uncharacterized protein n=1 Tax=Grifola frondosa TaxID=5627 RepID=A0A1C7MJ06_GRIFR|nr:hypothetical protein A0H81_02920 [Grifola frondosa]